MNRYIVFDVETTGLRPDRGDRIIEIGAVALMGEDTVDEFSTLVHPEHSIPRDVTIIHGITEEMLVGQPGPDEVIPRFHEFIGTSTLVAHNAEFDVTFLRYEFDRLGLRLNNRHRCTLKMVRKRYPGLPNYHLETVARRLLGISAEEGQRHRALDDARLTARIWVEMRRK